MKERLRALIEGPSKEPETLGESAEASAAGLEQEAVDMAEVEDEDDEEEEEDASVEALLDAYAPSEQALRNMLEYEHGDEGDEFDLLE